MQRRLATSILIALTGVPMVCAHANTDLERAAIERTLKAFTDGWNKHDAKEFSAVFTEDAEFTNVAGLSAEGRKAVEDFHAPRFATHFKNSNQVITRSKVKFIKPDVAAVDAWWEMTGARTPSGEDAGLRRGILNFVMVKVQDQWQVAVMRNTNLTLPSPGAP